MLKIAAAALPVLLAGCGKADEYIVKNQGFVIDFVAWVFSDVVQYVLFTPFEFFKSATAVSVLLKMSVFSGALVTVLAMIEGIKRMLSMRYTPIMQIVARYPLALIVSALAPFLFYGAGFASNEMVEFMGMITRSALDGPDYFSSLLQGIGEHIMETVLMFFFLIIMAFYLFKVILYHANRWFGLLFNMVTTPIAMSAYIFKPYENITSMWFKDSVGKFLVVIMHSFFLGLIGILLYAPTSQLVTDTIGVVNYLVVKLLFAIGGLQMMVKPPAWIRGAFDHGQNVQGAMQSFAPIRAIIRKFVPRGGVKK